MTERVWYRSLYWRIGLGFIACVAGLLIAQAVLFVWLTNPSGNPVPGGSPARLARYVATDLSAALDADPSLDVASYVRDQFGQITRPIVVVLRDGRVLSTRRYTPPPQLERAARARLARPGFGGYDGETLDLEALERARSGSGADRSAADPSDAGRSGSHRPDSGRGSDRNTDRGPRGRSPFAPIVVRGTLVGLVMAPLDGPPWLGALREHGPTLAVMGTVLLFAGTATMAFFVFRPAQRRLRDLQRAAAALGAGETSARASERGGDEVAGLAHAFNRMAGDLEARVRELHESDRARRQLLADVSHELMTPLTAMRGYLETLAMPQAVREPADRERYLQIVMDETLRLESIIGDLLELARLEGGGITLQRDDVAVEELFARAADRHGAALREKDITLETQIAPGAETVYADGRRLEQALQNLVANAVRHTPRGGRISLSAEAVKGSLLHKEGESGEEGSRERVRLVVRDSGPGISPEHLPLIFDRFYKADASREHQSAGSGLGLSIVKAIIERHGGTIAASSPPEGDALGGAVFEILLDAAPSP